ncbi:MAG: DnaJ domain-containing protein [Spirochaetaceae bacterium]
MSRYLGRLIGAAVGLTGGVYGVVVGFLVGTLLDNLLEERRNHRGLEAFLFTRRALGMPKERVELWSIAALATKLLTLRGSPLDEQLKVVRGYLGREFDLGRVDDLIEEVLLYPDALAEDLIVRRWSDLGENRKLWKEEVVCWFYELAGERDEGVSLEERGWIRRVAQLMGVAGEQLRQIEAEAPFLDAEAAGLLGVPRSADREELRRVYRRLASQFHPDTAGVLAEDQRRLSEAAFVRIREAYERLMRHLEELDR